jgi:uncharacterized protein (DUF433 family)
MSVGTDIGTLITRSTEIRGGRPIVAGTGVSVRRIVGWHQMGRSPQEIAEGYGHISLAQVYAALTYYYLNRQEIDDDLAQEEEDIRTIERELSQRTE